MKQNTVYHSQHTQTSVSTIGFININADVQYGTQGNGFSI